MISTFELFITFLLCLMVGLVQLYQWLLCRQRQRVKNPKTFAFFHPYASGGGGGERVLWKMIENLQRRDDDEDIQIVIFTLLDPIQTSTKNEALLRQDVQQRFDITISRPVQLISLSEYKHYMESKPFLSLIWESIGTMQLVYRAIQRCPDFDVYVDTTGCAFTFLVVRLWSLLKVRRRNNHNNGNNNSNNNTSSIPWIVAYVHYPTISTDMMAYEWTKYNTTNTNTSTTTTTTATMWIKTCIKLIYYHIFALLYGLVGSLSDITMVNSTWTYNHIVGLWKYQTTTMNRNTNNKIHIVYPPCRVPSTTTSSDSSTNNNDTNDQQRRQPMIVSIGQFRPEKNHRLQIEAFERLLQNHPELSTKGFKLRLIGSCRNDEDQARVTALQQFVHSQKLDNVVEFCINPPYVELQQSMYDSSMGIHTMREEHFGIGIVEMMAAGLIVIAHDSGGPKTDIITTEYDRHTKSDDESIATATGFRATTVQEYADAMYIGLVKMTTTQQNDMRDRARRSATRFSDDVFDQQLQHQIFPIFFADAVDVDSSANDTKTKTK